MFAAEALYINTVGDEQSSSKHTQASFQLLENVSENFGACLIEGLTKVSRTILISHKVLHTPFSNLMSLRLYS